MEPPDTEAMPMRSLPSRWLQGETTVSASSTGPTNCELPTSLPPPPPVPVESRTLGSCPGTKEGGSENGRTSKKSSVASWLAPPPGLDEDSKLPGRWRSWNREAASAQEDTGPEGAPQTDDATETIDLDPSLDKDPVRSDDSTVPVDENPKAQIFEPYLDKEAVRIGLEAKTLLQGTFRASTKKLGTGYVNVGDRKDQRSLVVLGKVARNRAVHGDVVIVQLIDNDDPVIKQDTGAGHENNDNDDAVDGSESEDEEEVVFKGDLIDTEDAAHHRRKDKTGPRLAKVVAIADQKGTNRVIVCTLHRNEKGSDVTDDIVRETDNFLKCKPTDKRMPWILLKINDVTKRALNIPGRLDRFQLWPIQMIMWKETSSLPLGRLKGQCLGNAGDLEAEEKHALIENELDNHDMEFDDDLLNEVDQIVSDARAEFPAEVARRVNLQKKRIFTIDPATAKDLDDAIHVDEISQDEVEIGVHIADVGHFVKLGSKADTEARYRTTSVYLINRVLPMLPHGLCNHLCSLNVNDPKLTFSCYFRLNRHTGELCDDPKPWFQKTSICSCCRLNYDEVQAVLDGKEIDVPPVQNYTWKDIKNDLFLLYEVCGKVRTGRMSGGALSISKTKMIFHTRDSEDGMPTAYHLESHSASHWIIEELMLLANRCVATHLANSFPNYDASVLRKHRPPDPDKQKTLNFTMKDLGFDWTDNGAGDVYTSCQAIYKEYGDVLGRCVEFLVMRSGMMQAEYFVYEGEKEEAHHYALNFDFYTHFTSPIRRYPDVMVHRVLSMLCEQEDVKFQTKEEALLQVGVCNEKKAATRHCADQLDRAVFCIFLRAKKEWFYTIGTVIGLPQNKDSTSDRAGNDTVTVYCSHIGKEVKTRLSAPTSDLYTNGIDDHLLLPESWRFQSRGTIELEWQSPNGDNIIKKQVLAMFKHVPIVIIPTNTVPIDYVLAIVSPFHRKFSSACLESPECAEPGYSFNFQ